MNKTTSPTTSQLIERYAQLHAELTALHSAAIVDNQAIDEKIVEIDAVHREIKAVNSRPEDPQRF